MAAHPSEGRRAGGSSGPAAAISPGMVGAAALLCALAGLLLWLWLFAAPAGIATGLLGARRHLEKAESALSRGAFKAARYEASAARAEARRARHGMDGPTPLLDLAVAVPEARRAFGQVPHLVEAAALTGRAALKTVDVAQTALKGPDPLIAKDGDGDSYVRVERVRALGRTLASILADVSAARSRLRSVRPGALPGAARATLKRSLKRAAETESALRDAHAGFEVLPSFLGATQPRAYLIAMQNPAEQRGTGGAILQFATLRVHDGRFDFGERTAQSVYQLDRGREPLTIPLPKDAWYVEGIVDAQRFGNSNWSPDWPLSSKLVVDYLSASIERCTASGDEDCPELPDLDGVIGVSPVTIQNVIPGTGPFTVPAGPRMSSSRVVHYVLYKAYTAFPIPSHRRAVLRQIVDGFYPRLFDPVHPSGLVDGLGESLSQKHVQMWFSDADLQGYVQRMKWDGAVEKATDSDYLLVVEQNVGGNKLDYFDEQNTDMSVRIDGDDAEVSTEVEYKNMTFQPQPRWIMGDSGPVHRPMVNLYAPGDAVLGRVEVDGTRLDTPPPGVWSGGNPPEHSERGKKVWSATPEVPAGESASVRFDYMVPRVVESRAGRRFYRLVVQHQPKVRPESLTIRLQVPPGASDIRARGWVPRGETLLWEGKLVSDMTLEVSWRR